MFIQAPMPTPPPKGRVPVLTLPYAPPPFNIGTIITLLKEKMHKKQKDNLVIIGENLKTIQEICINFFYMVQTLIMNGKLIQHIIIYLFQQLWLL